MSADFVYLASGSPRRRELLTQIGVSFRVVSVVVDESPLPGELAAAYVTRLAVAKARAALHHAADALVLTADTAVVLDGKIMGKPADRADGERMLAALSGRTHRVLTAIALGGGTLMHQRLSESEVKFRTIGLAERHSYWETGEPCDKAGGYAIQGHGAVFVEELRGSYSGVMGLPLFETAALLDTVGVPRWRNT